MNGVVDSNPPMYIYILYIYIPSLTLQPLLMWSLHARGSDFSIIIIRCWFYFTDERESVQKKTFQKWVNSHLVRVHSRIGDLYIDLRDGKQLIKLLEVLSGERLVSKNV